ncbi:oxygen-independent coproporphyrinogen-3 oxidase [Dyadobacter jejuensis]|uniref:Heme chaperone HemW n=1 Tax=Dyadobacter jejuensis TaxID=1082580 RepID=A0A316ALP9_9BACT|nr:radical SAM family heme chaperone HemW [Dyadobacter jejuensis]PWJ58491.1 oxygen-independent coproporphyrinogen-3 oxidase [Dyadobacter jejuensis]
MHIYIHIPFCRQACYYCDFHFSTNQQSKHDMVKAIIKELRLQKHYLPATPIETIYFGGGTPSLLSASEITEILDAIKENFNLRENPEITLEANPDDLTPTKLSELATTGINRLSIGIQSFFDPHLKSLNRAHNSSEALSSVRLAQQLGLTNISVDLIYAIPHPSHEVLYQDLQQVIGLGIPHISAYCLTIEPKTTFGNWLKNKKMSPIDESYAAEQFEILVHELDQQHYQQYEISNFATKGHYSKHNTAYWKAEPYLGVGPSAHSFNGLSRSFNVAHNTKFLHAIQNGEIPATTEILSSADKTNEYLLTGLRTMWGVRYDRLMQLSQGQFMQEREGKLAQLLKENLVEEKELGIVITQKGKLFADRIASELFID